MGRGTCASLSGEPGREGGLQSREVRRVSRRAVCSLSEGDGRRTPRTWESRGGSWSSPVLSVAGAAEQACERDKREQGNNGRMQPCVRVDIGGPGSVGISSGCQCEYRAVGTRTLPDVLVGEHRYPRIHMQPGEKRRTPNWPRMCSKYPDR